MLTCSQCGHTSLEGSAFCAHCGNSFPAPAPIPNPPAKVTTNCPSCGTEAAEDAKFCNSCGASLRAPTPQVVTHCAQCGAELIPGDKFCSKCGANVAQAVIPTLAPISKPSTETKPTPSVTLQPNVYSQPKGSPLGAASASTDNRRSKRFFGIPAGDATYPGIYNSSFLWWLSLLGLGGSILAPWTYGKSQEALQIIERNGGVHPYIKRYRASRVMSVVGICLLIVGLIWRGYDALHGDQSPAGDSSAVASPAAQDTSKTQAPNVASGDIHRIWKEVANTDSVKTSAQYDLTSPDKYDAIWFVRGKTDDGTSFTVKTRGEGAYSISGGKLTLQPATDIHVAMKLDQASTWTEIDPTSQQGKAQFDNAKEVFKKRDYTIKSLSDTELHVVSSDGPDDFTVPSGNDILKY